MTIRSLSSSNSSTFDNLNEAYIKQLSKTAAKASTNEANIQMIGSNISSSSLNVNKTDDSNAQAHSRKEEMRLFFRRLKKAIYHSINIIQAVFMRVVFSLHSLIAIFYVFVIKKDEWYLLNVIGVVFLSIELFITIVKRKGKEPRWFFPSFFICIIK